MPDDEIDDIAEPRMTPVVRESMPDGSAAALDREGNIITSQQWVKIRCVQCGAEGNAPIEATSGMRPDPETGIYSALCGTCVVGHKVIL